MLQSSTEQSLSKPLIDSKSISLSAISLACVAGATFLALFVLILNSTGHLRFDEPWYLSSVKLLNQYGLTLDYFRKIPGPAGPLHNFVQYLFHPWTNLRPPGVRLVSLLLFVLTYWTLILAFRAQKSESPIGYASLLVGAPMMALIGGMALTDIPPLFCFTVHLYCLIELCHRKEHYLTWAVWAGVFLSLTIAGRQTYLVTLAPLGMLFLSFPKKRKAFALLFTVGLSFPCFLFLTWESLIPPFTKVIHHSAYSVLYACVAFSYGAFIHAIFDPSFYIRQRRSWLLLSLAITLLAIFWWVIRPADTQVHIIAEGFVGRFLPQWSFEVYNVFALGVLFSTGAHFLFWAIHQLISCPKPIDRYLILSILAFLVACGKMGHFFSFKYVAPIVIPMIYFLSRREIPLNFGTVMRVALGSAFGVFLLSGYLKH